MELEPAQLINRRTQPRIVMPIFNQSSVIAEGWYFAMPASDLKPGQIRSIQIGHQEIVLWRTTTGKVNSVDAYCPHMGTHLSKGKVIGENIRCFFHHWQFDGQGQCQEVPAEPHFCKLVRTQSYAVEEKYGGLWVYPGAHAPKPLTSFIGLDQTDVVVRFDKSYVRSCHHHVTMINGIDAQHLKTVHGIDIEMNVDISESTRQIDIVLTGQIGNKGLGERIAKWLLGSQYSYGMRYDHASVGLLTLMKDASWFGRGSKIPSLHLIFAYRPMKDGKTFVQPIFVTARRSGIWGRLKSTFLIALTRQGFRALQGEDGEVYENMRFNPAKLLPMDRPVSKYIQYVNRLPASCWSQGPEPIPKDEDSRTDQLQPITVPQLGQRKHPPENSV